MKFAVTYTPDDVYEANKLHMYRLEGKRGIVIIIVGLIMGINVLLRAYMRIFDTSFFLLLVGTLIMFTYFIFRSGPVARNSARIYFKKAGGLQISHEFIINEKGMEVTSKLASALIKWESFNKYEYNDKMLIIYHTRVFNMIPHRCITSDYAWNNLISLVKQKIQE